MMKSRKQMRQEVIDLINKSDDALVIAVTTLFNKQTQLERQYNDSWEHNRRGFNKQDAGRFCRDAKVLLRGEQLPVSEMVFLRQKSRITKYWRQLTHLLDSFDRPLVF